MDWTKAEALQLISIVISSVLVIIGLILRRNAKDIHVLINSRMTELVEFAKRSSRAEGIETGRLEADARSVAKEARADERARVEDERTIATEARADARNE